MKFQPSLRIWRSRSSPFRFVIACQSEQKVSFCTQTESGMNVSVAQVTLVHSTAQLPVERHFVRFFFGNAVLRIGVLREFSGQIVLSASYRRSAIYPLPKNLSYTCQHG